MERHEDHTIDNAIQTKYVKTLVYEQRFQNLHYMERYEDHMIAHAIQAKYEKTSLWPGPMRSGMCATGRTVETLMYLLGFATSSQRLGRPRVSTDRWESYLLYVFRSGCVSSLCLYWSIPTIGLSLDRSLVPPGYCNFLKRSSIQQEVPMVTRWIVGCISVTLATHLSAVK